MTDNKKRVPMPKMVTRNCANPSCGKPFQARQVDVDRGWGKYCSNPCKTTAVTKKPPEPVTPQSAFFLMVARANPDEIEAWGKKQTAEACAEKDQTIAKLEAENKQHNIDLTAWNRIQDKTGARIIALEAEIARLKQMEGFITPTELSAKLHVLGNSNAIKSIDPEVSNVLVKGAQEIDRLRALLMDVLDRWWPFVHGAVGASNTARNMIYRLRAAIGGEPDPKDPA